MAEVKTTLRSLAKELGVAPSTVLRALTAHPNVTANLRHKVIALAKKRHYHLPERYKNLIAVIIPGYSFNSYSGLIASALMKELTCRQLHGEILSEKDLEVIHDKLYSGAISIVWDPSLGKRWPTEYSVPLVVINSVGNLHEGIYRIASDEKQGIRLGLNQLYIHGCRRIVMVTPKVADSCTTLLRLKVFNEFCQEKRLADSFHEEYTSGNTFDEITENIINRKADAVFAACEGYGYTLLFNLVRRGKKIPQDISILALDEPEFSAYTLPPLTAIAQDFDMLAHQAVNLLLSRFNDQPVPPEILVPYHFISRESIRIN